MENKKTISISLSTFFLILAIIAICVMGYFLYKFNDDKTKATEQVNELNNRITMLENDKPSLKAEVESKQTELKNNEVSENTKKENTDKESSTTNDTTSQNDNNTVVKEVEKQLNEKDVIALGYNQIAVLINGNVYVIPVFDRDNNYDSYKLYSVKGVNGKVKAIRQVYLGTDPSETNYLVMEDGSVMKMEGFGDKTKAEKVVESSKKIKDVIKEKNIVYAVSENGEKTKIDEENPDV